MSQDRSTKGFVEDCTDLLAEFSSHKSPTFANFSSAWKRFNFQYIFYGHHSDASLVQFTEDALIVVKHLFLQATNQLDRVGSLYLMYAMYFKQPAEQYCKLRFTQPEWLQLWEFHLQLRNEAPRLDQARLIFWKLVRVDAFRFVECEHECGFEHFMQKDKVNEAKANIDLVFKSIGASLGTELLALRDPHCGLEPALRILQDGYNEMKEHLDPSGSLLSATNLMETIGAGLDSIASEFHIESPEAKRERLLNKRRQQVDESAGYPSTFADESLQKLTQIGERRQQLKKRAIGYVGPTPAQRQERIANALNSGDQGLAGLSKRKVRCYPSRQERVLRAMEANMDDVRQVVALEEELLEQQQQTALNTKNATLTAIVEFDYTAKEPDELNLVKGAVLHNIKVQKGGWWEGTLASNGRTGMFPDNFVKVLEPDNINPVVLRDKTATASRRCKAVYSYTQNNQDELTLAVGDVIEFLDEVEEGWWRGRLAGKTGVFPSNFVVMQTQSPALAANRRSSTTTTTISPSVAASAAAAASNIHNISSSSSSSSHTNNTSSSSNVSNLSSASTVIVGSAASGNHQQAANAQAVAYAAAAIAKQMSSSREDLLLDAIAPDAPILPPKPVRELCKVLFPYTPANDDELELREGEIITILSRELPDKGWLKGELRGKIGVFPDNFVELISPEVSPIKEPTVAKPERPPSSTKMLIKNTSHFSSTSSSSATSTTTATSNAATTNNTTTNNHNISATSNSTASSGHKDSSFGSRDSLNESAAAVIPAGNVAAFRKSLEKQAHDITGALQASAAAAAAAATSSSGDKPAIEKPARKSFDTKGVDLRKSLENLDEKSSAAAAAPPMLTKKPLVPIKKSPTVSSVANSIFSGLKSKVGGGGSGAGASGASSNSKSSIDLGTGTAATAASAKPTSDDSLDGIAGSRMYNLSDGGNVVGERIRQGGAADFDQVERGQSILQDMRAGRAKAPKRRPPTSAISSQHSSSEGSSTSGDHHQNGDAPGTNGEAAGSAEDQHDDQQPGGRQRQSSQSRNWEKQKAPWMDELRASQAKKVSPSALELGAAKSLDHDALADKSQQSQLTQSQTTASVSAAGSASFDMSKSYSSTQFSSIITSSSSSSATSSSAMSSSQQVKQVRARSQSEYNHLDDPAPGAANQQQPQHQTSASATGSEAKKTGAAEFNNNNMARSMSGLTSSFTKLNFGTASNNSSNNNTNATANTQQSSTTAASSASSSETAFASATSSSSSSSSLLSANTTKIGDSPSARKPRPTSVNLRQRSISPIGPGTVAAADHLSSAASTKPPVASTIGASSSSTHQQATIELGSSITVDNVCPRVAELEQKVDRLERIIQQQQQSLEDVMRAHRDEVDRVRSLRAELDKYAQFVTQV